MYIELYDFYNRARPGGPIARPGGPLPDRRAYFTIYYTNNTNYICTSIYIYIHIIYIIYLYIHIQKKPGPIARPGGPIARPGGSTSISLCPSFCLAQIFRGALATWPQCLAVPFKSRKRGLIWRKPRSRKRGLTVYLTKETSETL